MARPGRALKRSFTVASRLGAIEKSRAPSTAYKRRNHSVDRRQAWDFRSDCARGQRL